MSGGEGLPDIVAEGLRVLFVGTAVGHASAARGHYYSGPGNSFYADLYHSGLTDRQLCPEEDGELPRYGLGLTDVAKATVTSDDSTLGAADFNRERLTATVRRVRPRVVCFNGANAYRAWRGTRPEQWGPQVDERLEGVPVFVVPSTSGRVSASRPLDGRTRLEWFQELASWLDGGPGSVGTRDGTGHSSEGGTKVSSDARQLAEEIIRIFESRGRAPYTSGDGYLTYVGRNASELTVLRRHGNPRPWKVPIRALEEAVRRSCEEGRPLPTNDCNAICNRRGTPLVALLGLLPAERYRTAS